MVYRAFLVFFTHYIGGPMTHNEQIAVALLKRMATMYFLKMFLYTLTRRLAKRYS